MPNPDATGLPIVVNMYQKRGDKSPRRSFFSKFFKHKIYKSLLNIFKKEGAIFSPTGHF